MTIKPIFTFPMPLGFVYVYNEKPEFEIRESLQTHSCIILPQDLDQLKYHEADGLCSRLPNPVPLSIKTADCMPIFIQGKDEVVFLHAGWKGLAQGILKSSLIKNISPTFAFIGPSIQPHNFEVTEEFRSNFPRYPQYFTAKENGRLCFNLQQTAIDELKKINPQMQIQNSGICTVDELKLRSFRREKLKCRNWNVYHHKEIY